MQRDTNRLTLTVLGAPSVRRQGRVVTFATRKALALLLYLVLEGGLHTREAITDLLWPESDHEHGRAALRRTLMLLRQALPDADDYLVIERDRLGFTAAAAYDLDAHVLDMAVRAGPAREALPQLQAAVEAYRGAFLTGFSLADAPAFDEWASLQREYRHRQLESVLDWLSHLHAESGATGPAIDVATRWVAHAPLNEAAHRRLMMCLFIAGNRPSALQAYETCRLVLHEELDVAPAPETEALAARIRAEAPPPPPAARRPPDPAVPAAPESSLVGRSTEFGRLVAAYRTAAQGHPGLATLEGEAGIGKTRLALDFAAWARAQGAQVLHGRAFEAGDRVPYQPLVDALRQVDPQVYIPALSPTWLAELAALLPELRDLLPAARPAPARGDAATRTRLFEAVAQLTRALATAAPLLLTIDDAHWADAASLDVLHYLVRRWNAQATPALLLLAFRFESLTAPLTAWLSGVERETQTTRCALGALTADDLRHLVEALIRPSPDADLQRFSRWLFAETGGHPFFVSETLKALAERGILVRQPPAEGWSIACHAGGDLVPRGAAHLPRGIQALIRSRLARLAPPAQTLLTAGAVLGRDFQFETMCAVAGLSEDDGLAALDELLHSYLVREGGRGSTPQRLAIAHDTIRDVVYADASRARLRVFHRRAFEVLQQTAAPPGELARHALAAELTEAAFRCSLAAGDEALRLFALRTAIEQYEQALALSASLQLAAPHLHPLYLSLGRAYELEGDFAQARAAYEALLAAAQQAEQPEAECLALNRLATLAAQAELDFETALEHLSRARSVAEGSGDTSGLAETEWNLAQVSYYRLDPAAIAHGERALAMVRTLGRPDLLARSLNGLAWALGDLRGEWAAAEAHAGEARALYRALEDRAMEADCLCLLTNAALYLGQPRAAIAAARTAQAISLEIDNPWGQAHSAFQLAKCLLDAGEYGEALAQAQRGAALARERQMPMLSVLCLALLGTVQRTLGLVDQAGETHREASAILAALPALAPAFEAMIAVERVADHVASGEWQAACAEALHVRQRAVEHNLERTFPFTLLLSLVPLVAAILRAGEQEAAAALLQDLGPPARANRRSRVAHLRAAALVAHSQGATEQAIAQLQEAAALAEDIGLPGDLWQIYAALADLHPTGGAGAQAEALRSRAAAIVRTLAHALRDERLRAGFLAAAPGRLLVTELC